MPNLGYDMAEGIIASWTCSVGVRVERGECLAEIETDKTTIEMESTVSGTLVSLLYEAGATVAIGEVIALIED